MVITITLIMVGILFPLAMIFLGRWLFKNAPKDINFLVGYRTKKSMASKEAWDFANTTAGKYWFSLGSASLPIFAIISLLVAVFIEHDNVTHINFGIYGIVALQLIPFLSVIPYTEKKLKVKFK